MNSPTQTKEEGEKELSLGEKQQLLDYECPICLDTLIQPVKTTCESGHVFCHHCIFRWIAESKLDCPVCRSFIDETFMEMDELNKEIATFYSTLPDSYRKERLAALKEREVCEAVFQTEQSQQLEDNLTLQDRSVIQLGQHLSYFHMDDFMIPVIPDNFELNHRQIIIISDTTGHVLSSNNSSTTRNRDEANTSQNNANNS